MEEGKKEDEKYFRFASLDANAAVALAGSSIEGLSHKEALRRLALFGRNNIDKGAKLSLTKLIWSKIFNPLISLLLAIAVFSLFFGEKISALLVSIMIAVGIIIDVIQEYHTGKAVEKLNAMVRSRATVRRDNKEIEIDIHEIVPGDIVKLSAGDIVPADLRIVSCNELTVNQSSLTGESFPSEKTSSKCAATGSILEINNIIFMGSSIVGGGAEGVVLETGKNTEFGRISKSLAKEKAETNFDKGIKNFTYLMLKAIFFLVLFIFGVILILKAHSIKEALLFSLAIAVGLAPEMLPMIVAINLSKGASAMAKKQVIVKKLDSIQNFGAMDVLCTDKTGTLTMDEIVLEHHCDVRGVENDDVLKFAFINSFHQTGLKNVLDQAILKHEHHAKSKYVKLDELPFDFIRRIMSVAVRMDKNSVLISKGAPEEIFKRCSHVEILKKSKKFTKKEQELARLEYEKLSKKGFRVIAVAYRKFSSKKKDFNNHDESQLVLKGFAAFLDPAKPGVKATLASLHAKGIEVKILTGDNEIVTKKICEDVNLDVKGVITGTEINGLTETQLEAIILKCTIFARLTPNQKERVIQALQKKGHTVGYLGDGINDAPSLRAADIGISVDNAIDIAKETADIILLKKSLASLEEGVVEGRKTFGNTAKYIKMSASSNFGNMFSMAGATVFLPFLPMLPVQVLLNNFFYDIANLPIPTDSVDSDYIHRPRPWNVDFIKKYMIYLGPISSFFDFLTFWILWTVFGGYLQTPDTQAIFQTGWFLESLCSQTLIIYVIRTDKIPFIQSRPSTSLLIASLAVISAGIALTYSHFGASLGFTPLPISYFAFLGVILITYFTTAYLVKLWLVKRHNLE